jgi:YD repeat-containing protein
MNSSYQIRLNGTLLQPLRRWKALMQTTRFAPPSRWLNLFFLVGLIESLGFVEESVAQLPVAPGQLPTFILYDAGSLGGSDVGVNAVNDLGFMVGAYYPTNASSKAAFMWTPLWLPQGGMTTIWANGYANDLNNSNQVVGNQGNSAVTWQNGVLTPLGITGTYAGAWGINDAGVIVGTFDTNSGYNAYVLSNGIMTTLPGLGGVTSALRINQRGNIAGYSDGSGGRHAIGWTNGGTSLVTIPLPGQGAANGLNGLDQFVADDADFGVPFFWGNGRLTQIASNGSARGINNWGWVVGFTKFSGNMHAFLWVDDNHNSQAESNEVRDLNASLTNGSGWTLSTANGINNLGVIVGNGLLNGQPHAFVLVPLGVNINSGPMDYLANPGGIIHFEVSVTSAAPISYQWTRNGIPLTNAPPFYGANSSSLTISNYDASTAVTNLAGTYSLLASNLLGAAASRNASLSIVPVPGPPVDSDGDGLTDYAELYIYHTNPNSADSDGDGIPDWWEILHGMNPRVNDANSEIGSSGVTYGQVYQYDLTHTNQLDPRNPFFAPGTSIYEGINTGQHTNRFYYDHNDRLIGAESSRGISIGYQYDGNDNLTRQTVLSRTAETNGLPVLWQFLNGLTNGTPADGPYGDPDGDGWNNYQEWLAGTDPSDPTSVPNILGVTGTNVVGFSAGFTPSDFVMGSGQLDGIGADEIVIGADGNPGNVTNSLFILSQTGSGWTTQTVAIGKVGITSIAVGQPAHTVGAAVYVGTRNPGGTGTVVQIMLGTNGWQVTSLSIGNTSQVAYVLGVRPNSDVLVNLSTTNGLDQSLYSLAVSNGTWIAQSLLINSSHRGLGTVALTSSNDTQGTSLRLLDSGGIQLGDKSYQSTLTNVVIVKRSDTNLWYFMTPMATTWSNAQAYARQYDGNLATIPDSTVNSWILSQYSGDFWVGLYSPSGFTDGVNGWQWVSGSTSNYRDWAAGNPDSPTTWFYVHMYYGSWRNIPNGVPLPGLVEFDLNSLSSIVIAEPLATNRILWQGYSLASGSLRQTNGASIFYAFADDKNLSGQISTGDDFVVTEYLLMGTNATMVTSNRVSITGSVTAQSYGLASVNILNSSNDVFFTAEPDGNVYSWSTTNSFAPLQRQLFDGHYQGMGWQQLSAYHGLAPGESLVGLMVNPASPSTCQLVYWGPQQTLWTPPNVPETAPYTVIMPSPSSGGALSPVNITIWKNEGNNCYPVLQYQDPVSSNWLNATILTIDGVAYSPILAVTALPTGTLHTLAWNALASFGAPYSNSVLLRARSSDFMLTGDWSTPSSYTVAISADTVVDGIPNWWRAQYFGGSGTNTNSVSCASCDPDGDGMNNLQEYLTGTVPTNGASSFHVTSVLRTNNDLFISWMTGIGRTNALQVGTGTGGSYATNFADIFTVTNTVSTTTNYLDLGAATNTPARYYRVRLVP